MNTPTSRKFLDLANALSASPRHIAPWLHRLPLWKKMPAEVELPWFSFEAIEFLKKHLQPHHRVFEFGSGGSTVFFARQAGEVVSVESDPVWHARLAEILRQKKISNVRNLCHPLTRSELAGYRNNPFFDAVSAAQWDIVVIDCYCGYLDSGFGPLRPYAFERSLSHVAPGGCIVLDDSWMFPELLTPREGWAITDFRGIGPCRYGVTSTAIFQRLT